MKTLVLLHGWGASSRVWQRQTNFFGKGPPAKTGPGLVKNSPGQPLAWDGLRVLTPTIPYWDPGWLTDYLQRLPLEDGVLVGWSLGGMLLVETLVHLPAAPAAVVLVGVAAVFCRRQDHPWGPKPATVRAMRQALKNDPHQVLREFVDNCLAPGEENLREETWGFFNPTPAQENLRAGLDYLLRRDLRPHLAQVPGRTVIVQGDEDRIVPLAQARFLHEQIPGSRLNLLPGAGHLPFLTQAAAFNEMLEGILRGGPGERSSPALPSSSPPHPLYGAG